ncbi:MAG: cellulase family glycosylhydrolase [Ruminiclostridium sp.]|nr:cellulase family glycosylhydrolase [Ruminiclostridium sp.]
MKKIIRKALSFLMTAVLAMSAAAVPAFADDSRQKLPDNQAMRFVDGMGAGWNLGNAFDAISDKTPADEMTLETFWCGAKTTRELIKAVKKAGFGTIRIPVSWHNHVDKDLNISDAWMSRVKEVVDWCLEEGLYVIINIHHDNGKNDYAYYQPSAEEKDRSVKYISSVWKQISKTFRNYGEKLVFEGLNEPRLTGTNYEWWFDTKKMNDEVKAALENINLFNQTFVDTVRASGGKNANRYLLIVGYAGKNDECGVLSDYYKLPDDTVKNRLIVDCHYYGIGVKTSPKVIDGMYNKYTSKGIPAMVTEYGLNENGYKYVDQEDTATERMGEFFAYARNRGVSVVIWDNNYGNKGQKGHKFIDRKTATVIVPKLVKAITKNGAPALSGSKTSADTSSAGPKVTAKSTAAGKVTLSWDKVEGATKYAVYQYVDGAYKSVKSKVTKTTYTIKGLTSGSTYRFAVRAYVNGKWTTLTSKDSVKIKVK